MKTQTGRLSRHFLGLAARAVETELPDRELLARFLATRDTAAFAALVRRHGPMVLAVCRRHLRDSASADDAFQATFLLLSRKAGGIRKQDSLAAWLHGVARRTALKAQVIERRRLKLERQPPTRAHQADPVAEVSLREALAILDEELARLPDKYRAPLVLCCLEDRTRDEAAQQLGWPVQLLKSRLEQARDVLRQRLTRRGIALSSGLVASLMGTNQLDAMPSALLGATLETVLSEAVAPSVAALAKGAMTSMPSRIVSKTVAIVLGVGLLACGLALWMQPAEVRVGGVRNHAMAWRQAPKAAQPVGQGRIYFHAGGYAIHSMEPNGQDQKALPRADPRDEHYYQPLSASLSRDGKRLAFGQSRQEGNNFYPPDKIRVRQTDSSNHGEVLAEIPGVEMHHFVWSPDGKQLAFTTWDKDHQGRNWIVDVQTKQIEQLNLPKYKDGKKEYEMWLCDWAPDGRHFLASGQGMQLVTRDGKLVRRLSEELTIFNGQCRFSPDGKKALFVTSNKNHSNTLYVTDVASGEARPIVEAANFTDMRAFWSPDGKRIAYVATIMDANGKRGDETNLFTIDADGQNITQVRSDKHGADEIKMVMIDWR